jgi:hypothetical protein
MLYNQGGKINAINAAPRLPIMLRKSVKLGMSKAIPVINRITKDLLTILFAFF